MEPKKYEGWPVLQAIVIIAQRSRSIETQREIAEAIAADLKTHQEPGGSSLEVSAHQEAINDVREAIKANVPRGTKYEVWPKSA